MNSPITVSPLLPRLQKFFRLAGLLLVVVSAVSLPAGTQADASKSKTAQAVLHIQVQVVPVSQLPQAQRTSNSGAVVYDIPNPTAMEVSKQSRPMPAGVGGTTSGQAVLETTTVVPR